MGMYKLLQCCNLAGIWLRVCVIARAVVIKEEDGICVCMFKSKKKKARGCSSVGFYVRVMVFVYVVFLC